MILQQEHQTPADSQSTAKPAETHLDPDGFLKTLANWNRAEAQKLAIEHEVGPLTDDHWRPPEFVQSYYTTYGTGPSVVKIHETTGLSSRQICDLFPCGTVRGAYRLAGPPRPPGCAG